MHSYFVLQWLYINIYIYIYIYILKKYTPEVLIQQTILNLNQNQLRKLEEDGGFKYGGAKQTSMPAPPLPPPPPLPPN